MKSYRPCRLHFKEKTRTQTGPAKFRLEQAFLPLGPDDLAGPVKLEDAVHSEMLHRGPSGNLWSSHHCTDSWDFQVKQCPLQYYMLADGYKTHLWP